jgi:Spy/CpxP family protein refolding chaperone
MVAMVAVAVALGTASAWAGGSCCSMKKSKAGGLDGCDKVMSSLDLSAEQKTKIDEIKAACDKDGGSKEACEKSMTEIRDVLTAEQQAKWDEAIKAAEATEATAGEVKAKTDS